MWTNSVVFTKFTGSSVTRKPMTFAGVAPPPFVATGAPGLYFFSCVFDLSAMLKV
jgi:hypothetical protein